MNIDRPRYPALTGPVTCDLVFVGGEPRGADDAGQRLGRGGRWTLPTTRPNRRNVLLRTLDALGLASTHSGAAR